MLLLIVLIMTMPKSLIYDLRILLSVACAMILLLPGASAQETKKKAGPGLSLNKVGVFPGKHETKTAEIAEDGSVEERVATVYLQHFPQSKTAYLTTQVSFKNERFGQNEYAYEVMMGLYTYDNRPISANKKKMIVASDWQYAWTSQTYGWPEPGKWSVGTYRIKVWVDGALMGETAFYVFNDTDSAAKPDLKSRIKINQLELYEGGDFFRPGLTKSPATEFPRRTTRRIFWVVRGINELFQARAQRPNLIGYFYKPDGTLLGESSNQFLIAPEVKDIVLVEGVGWSVPGNWDVGEYRFELEQDNELISERKFSITDRFAKPKDTTAVVHYGVLDAGVFAGEVTVPEDDPGRLYGKKFEKGELTYIWAELVLANNPNHKELHSHKMHWEFIGPGGVLMGQAENDFSILPEWKIARQKASIGHDDPKKWEIGHYKVRISIDGHLERVVRFEITEPSALKAK